MKFFNFFFAILLVVAFTSCDATKKVSTATPSTTSSGNVATAKQAPTKVTKPASTATKKKPMKPKMDTDKAVDTATDAAKKAADAASKSVDIDKPKAPTKPTMTKPKKPTKSAGTDITKPGKVDKDKMMKTPGMITWAAANDRYSAQGTFTSWNITDVKMVGDDLNTLTAKIEIDLTSISEKSPKLTDHLKADDYFGVAKYKTATIHVTKVNKGMDVHTANMVLKMRGKEQKMKGTFKVTSMKPLRIAGSANVDRSIFGIGVDNTGVPNEIKVNFDTVIPR